MEESSSRQQTQKLRVSPLIAAGLLVFAALASLLAQIFIFPGKATDGDWQRASAYIVEHIEADDALRIHPSWTEAPMPYLQKIGNQLHRQHHPLLEDLQGIQRIWILSETEHLQDALRRLPFEPSPALTERFGTVTAVLIDLPESTQFPYIFNEHLQEAKVSRYSPGADAVEDCKTWDRNQRRWHCARRDRTFYVGDAVQELGDDPRHCIWAHALPNQRILRIEFPEVPLYNTLRIRAGLERVGSSRVDVTPVDYRVYLNDELILEQSIPKDSSTWPAHDVKTSEQNGQTANVRIEIQSEHERGRHFCFNGWTF